MKQASERVSEIIKNHSITVNIQMTRNYLKSFEKLKNTMKHQEWY